MAARAKLAILINFLGTKTPFEENLIFYLFYFVTEITVNFNQSPYLSRSQIFTGFMLYILQ